MTPPPPSVPRSGLIAKGHFLRLLTNAQLGSGLVFSTFLVCHFLPPALIAITGEERAGSSFMLLGRVFYQGPLSEALIVYGSLAVHVLSSLLKRLISPPKRLPRSSHSLTGFLLTPLVGHHVLTHRLGPASSTPTVRNLSPSELDYSYVAASLELYPLLEGLTYGLLAGAGIWHALGGLQIVHRRWGRPLLQHLSRSANIRLPSLDLASRWTTGSALFKDPRRWTTVLGSLLLVIGLVRLQKDAFVPAHLSRRVAEAHRIVLPWLYR